MAICRIRPLTEKGGDRNYEKYVFPAPPTGGNTGTGRFRHVNKTTRESTISVLKLQGSYDCQVQGSSCHQKLAVAIARGGVRRMAYWSQLNQSASLAPPPTAPLAMQPSGRAGGWVSDHLPNRAAVALPFSLCASPAGPPVLSGQDGPDHLDRTRLSLRAAFQRAHATQMTKYRDMRRRLLKARNRFRGVEAFFSPEFPTEDAFRGELMMRSSIPVGVPTPLAGWQGGR